MNSLSTTALSLLSRAPSLTATATATALATPVAALFRAPCAALFALATKAAAALQGLQGKDHDRAHQATDTRWDGGAGP